MPRSCVPTSTAPGRRKGGSEQALGRSKGGLSTKIRVTVDARGRPTAVHLTAGHACELEDADVLLLWVQAPVVIADKALMPTTACSIP